jgi:Transglycosylase SLT domain
VPLSGLNQSFRPNPLTTTLGIYIGFVKDNSDAQRMGRLSVFIPELGGDPSDPGAWVIVSYASPFAGATDPTKINQSSQTMEGSQQSYGFWMIPPDLNNEVAVFFANNEMSRGYWFACCFQQNMNHMIPGIAIDITTEPSPPIKIGPVVEYNKANVGSVASPRRPRFMPLSDGLAAEGLTRDYERGSSSTSAQREAPSQVFGYLSPRGNTTHIDDNPANEFIRMRTRSGAQVLIHETTGYVYINSKNGNSWAEISDSGIDMYTSKSISMRAEQDFNIRADRDIILDAGANIRMRAGNDITVASGGSIEQEAKVKINLNASNNIELVAAGSILASATIDIQANSGQDLVIGVGNAGSLNVVADLQIKSGQNLRLQSANDMTLLCGANLNLQAASDLTEKAGGVLRMSSTKDMSQLAGGNQVRDGATILDNTKAAPPAPIAAASNPDTPRSLTPPMIPIGLILGDAKQSLINPNSSETIWKRGAGQINTIVSRMPTHEPWREHPSADVPPPPTECVDVVTPPMLDAGIAGGVSTNPDGSISAGATASNVNPDGSLTDAGCSAGVAGTKKIATEVYNAIMNACTKTGADPACMLAFADIESSFQPGVSAKGTSATGLYQFISSTWTAMVTKYGSRYNVGFSQINDPTANALMGGQLLNDDAAYLKKQGIANPTPGQLYMCHMMGQAGATRLITAAQTTPNGSASLAFPAQAAKNPVFTNRSLSEVVANLSALADTKAKAYAGQYGLPAPCDRGAGGPITMNSTGAAAAAMTAPVPIDMHQPVTASFVSGGTGAVPDPAPVVNAAVGGGSICDPGAGLGALDVNTKGFSGPTSSPASLLRSVGLTNVSEWRKGSSDPSTWAINQSIAIFDDNAQFGNSRAAIFLGLIQQGNPRYEGKQAFLVYDQEPGQPAKERIIYYDGSKNAAMYAAVNLAANPQLASTVQAACIQNYPAHTGDCSGFVQAVGRSLKVPITGRANDIVGTLRAGGSWRTLADGNAALNSAKAGKLVVAGLLGSEQAQPNQHGHVVVVVDGPVAHGKYPTAYWGALGGTPGNYQTLNNSWTTQDRDKITYAEHDLGST